MEIIDQYHQFEYYPKDVFTRIAQAARTCYKSEGHSKKTNKELVEMLIRSGHESVLEHVSASVRFITDKGVTHELVRHRLASFSQESTRYVNYTKNNHMQFIRPVWVDEEVLGKYNSELDMDAHFSDAELVWLQNCYYSEEDYNNLIKTYNRPPQKARQVLNNSVKTEIVVTANIRELRHILNLRCSHAAHPQIRALLWPVLKDFECEYPELFSDVAFQK